jgi:L-asparaginase
LKIAVIFTGGTIGSKIKDGWISTERETKFELVESFKSTDCRDIQFVCSEPYFALSENLTATELNALLSAYKAAEQSDVDGIIITHGTDSIHFSAATLSLVSNGTKPTVIVSANYPISDKRSNGPANFAAAVDFIEQSCGKGVFISYKNPDGEHFFHEGHRVVAFLEGDDRLYSMNHAPFAEYKDKKITVLNEAKSSPAVEPCTLCENSGILSVSAMPGDGFCYSLDGIKAIIVKPYHSGTVATANPAFKAFCEKAYKNGIKVFLVNAPMNTTYDSVKMFCELHITPLADVTFCEAYMRLWFGISGKKDLEKLF